MGVFVFRSRSNMRFVFGKRKGSLGSGTFALTGGHLEFGETFEQGARREVLEETGLEIVDVKFLTTVENFYEQEGKHYITIFVVAFAKGGGESGEAIEAQVSLSSEPLDGATVLEALLMSYL